MRAVIVRAHGGPEALAFTDTAAPAPGPGEIQVEVRVAGINYMDVYQRDGAVPRDVPFAVGVEGVGVVTEVGSDVADFSPGERVGWFSGGSGSHAEIAVVDAARAVRIPDAVSDELATAALMQGITAQYLATSTYPVGAHDSVLVHAAAGGVGHLLTQIAGLRGGRVIGTASTPSKIAAVLASGASAAVPYENFAEKVRELTGGAGVSAVYDGVGAATFEGSLASLKPRGVLAIYGTASGPTPPLDIPRLNSGGSLYVTRPSIAHYTADTAEMRARAAEVFDWIAAGELKVHIGGEFPLAEARHVYIELEDRRTSGKLLLRP
ncbi:quinone oxidoreductase [Amycolatopsis sp. La24]|uniref:quinone oxidoreductase family protein n=1 Tax=Amycolatopsis sp. La24 TaxID=3028304 RepID=UPI0023B0D47C|nr:quinone oxidoreductase [Amycolatopsis sp. La24]